MKAGRIENRIRNFKIRMYMLLRQKLTDEWEQFVNDITYGLNHNYIYGTDNITPQKAHLSPNKYDVVIRKIRHKRVPEPYPFRRSKQQKVIEKYLRSKESRGKKIGSYVYLNFNPGSGMGTKSYDFQVS